ncbi:hypothetical protein N7472_004265 [Penicillium cf. griseofulvum]|uniref:Uncharacterized protein n=1 Tax=Penicillium cf. griseofulvum TaxID=2972120 RepID=A0A9W9MDF0_9EURO|nr:hypothetical protein N7472_004265 [Penicillium cf. griseofulvum]
MVSTTINFSGLMCLVLALGPASVLSSPQLPTLPFPELINHGPETTSHGPGNTETSAGHGVNMDIPGGPNVDVGAGFHDAHRGPCGPGSGSDQSAGAGVFVGMPGGPDIDVGQGMHHHQGGFPCPEVPAPVVVPVTTINPPPVVVVPTTTETYTPPTWTAIPAILPPTFTTPISVPLTTAPAPWAPAVPTVRSTPLIHVAPTASASPSAVPYVPVFNGGSSLVPGSVLAVAVPIILAFF